MCDRAQFFRSPTFKHALGPFRFPLGRLDPNKSFGAPAKHEVGEHRFAWVVHLATARARCKDVAQLGQRNVGAVLGDQAGFAVAVQAASVGPGAGLVPLASRLGEGQGRVLERLHQGRMTRPLTTQHPPGRLDFFMGGHEGSRQDK